MERATMSAEMERAATAAATLARRAGQATDAEEAQQFAQAALHCANVLVTFAKLQETERATERVAATRDEAPGTATVVLKVPVGSEVRFG